MAFTLPTKVPTSRSRRCQIAISVSNYKQAMLSDHEVPSRALGSSNRRIVLRLLGKSLLGNNHGNGDGDLGMIGSDIQCGTGPLNRLAGF